MIFNRRERLVNRYFIGVMSDDEKRAFHAAVEQDRKLQQLFNQEQRIQAVLTNDRDAAQADDTIPPALIALMQTGAPSNGTVPDAEAALEESGRRRAARRYLWITLAGLLLLGAFFLWLETSSTSEDGNGRIAQPPGGDGGSSIRSADAPIASANPAGASMLPNVAATVMTGSASTFGGVWPGSADSAAGASRNAGGDSVLATGTSGTTGGGRTRSRAASDGATAKQGALGSARRAHSRAGSGEGDAEFLKHYLHDGNRRTEGAVHTDTTVHMRIKR